MKKSTREAARISAENRKKGSQYSKIRAKIIKEGHDRAFTIGLEKDNAKKINHFEIISNAAVSWGYNEDADKSEFWKVIVKKASRLIDEPESLSGLLHISELKHVRPISEWKPKGKSASSLFNSVCNHCIAKYPTPQFLWGALKIEGGFSNAYFLDFLDPKRKSGRYKFRDAVTRIASGESFSKICKEEDFPLAFTKNQCHEYLKTSSKFDPLSAVRRVQVKTHNGSQAFFDVWNSYIHFNRLMSREYELFWSTVLATLCSDSMFDVNQMSPLLDYIRYRKTEDEKYSMKGRTIGSLIRGMEEWHEELNRVKVFKASNYDSSGFLPLLFKEDKKINKSTIQQHWTVDEIRTSKDLAQEGKILHHCVYSYSDSISNGSTSIWSLKNDGVNLITIQVINSTKSVVQVRGNYNRKINNEEFKILDMWAKKNAMTITDNKYW